jgi:prepilin-type N-terminal cleavage/methylation domain-containing protein
MKRNNKAFTLAEVLIVLGIIGIIAELTIPTLVQNTQVQVLKTMSKKEVSILNQALTMTNTDNGSIKGLCGDHDHKCLRDLFLPYMKYIKTCESPNNATCFSSRMLYGGWQDGSSVILNDGTSILFYAYDSNCSGTQGDLGQLACGEALIDLNGYQKGPNDPLQFDASDKLTTKGDTLWVEITPTQVNWGNIRVFNNVYN